MRPYLGGRLSSPYKAKAVLAQAACPSLKSRAERGPAAHPSRVGGMTAPFLKNGRLKWSCRLPLKRQAGPVCHPFLKNGLQAACCPLL